ncbi:MAG: cell division protein ZipA [endosymbiont of Galathealinum brachiosum]|uniref:Cell division protein ZipA n=1 Tax=endosymbiont of Galathealinum brachiosum TaxID=2200906 RepID=A0A370D6N7_9GAMM|nr:MAG: cell division protein ZipA [endosymbiont of Galathealinum brachiosum]
MKDKPKLHLMCGKMASGKSTLAVTLARDNNAILIIEDEWLTKLYPDEIHTINDYIKYSIRLQNVITPHVSLLLNQGISVVLDFPANTKKQRNWLLSLSKSTKVSHLLHYVVASDEKCKAQLKKRNKNNPDQIAFTSEEEFDTINQYFQPPYESEKLNIRRHQ